MRFFPRVGEVEVDADSLVGCHLGFFLFQSYRNGLGLGLKDKKSPAYELGGGSLMNAKIKLIKPLKLF